MFILVRGRGDIFFRGTLATSCSDFLFLHGEMDCLQNAGRLTAKDYQKSILYTTLSPCDMCTGTVLLYKIPRLVMAENTTFKGGEDLLRERGVEVVNLDLPEAVQLMRDFIKNRPELWNEDIGV